MSADGSTSPDDPAWVDAIVRRALERAEEGGVADATQTVSAPPVTTAEVPRLQDGPTTDDALLPEGEEAAGPIQRRLAAAARNGRGTDDPLHRRNLVDDAVATDGFAMNHAASPTVASPVGPTSGAPSLSELPPTSPYPDMESLPALRHDDLFDSPHIPEARVDHGPAHAEPGDEVSSRMRGFLEWGAVVVGALAVALLIKTFLMQAYFIPSSSMEDTLNIGDRVLVNKLSYQFGEIGRGDLVVFHRPPSQPEGEDDLIKRVIGLEGEVVEIRDGKILITTKGSDEVRQLDEPYLAEGITTTGFVDTSGCENATPTSCEVPDGHILVLGDNRPGSKDGRFFGPIDEDLVVGRAFLRVWPLSDISFL